jgi:hypothetical protein
MAPGVAALMADELGRDASWQVAQVMMFEQTARGYRPASSNARTAEE